MKKLLFLILSVFSCSGAFAQQEPLQQDAVFTMVEQMPQFPGGDVALLKYLDTAVHYPKAAIKEGLQGKVYTKFVVNENGSISDVSLLRSAGKALDNEALRVIAAMPPWKPGKQNGRPVRVYFQLPIVFKLKE